MTSHALSLPRAPRRNWRLWLMVAGVSILLVFAPMTVRAVLVGVLLYVGPRLRARLEHEVMASVQSQLMGVFSPAYAPGAHLADMEIDPEGRYVPGFTGPAPDPLDPWGDRDEDV